MQNIEVKKSINGFRIFARTQFQSGDDVFKVKGYFISCDVCDNIDDKTRDNAFRYDEEKYLSPAGEIGDFLNHSCDPNSAVVKKEGKLFIVAVNNINADEEVTIDYSTILASDDSWEMVCNCGSENCRKLIKTFNSLPNHTKQRYLSLNMVPDYILD